MTHRQRELLVFIEHYQIANGGVSPSIREMASGLNTKSVGSISEALEFLEYDGWITRLPNRARAIHILKSSLGARLLRNGLPVAALRFISITDHDQPPGRGAEPFSPKGGSALVSDARA